LKGKWGVRAHPTQEMKGKEGSGDPEGQETKSRLASSRRRLDTCGEKGFFADAVIIFTYFYLHIVPGGLPSYILRTGSGRTVGGDVYSIIKCFLLIVVFGVGKQLLRQPVITRRSNAGAAGRYYLYSSKFVRLKVG